MIRCTYRKQLSESLLEMFQPLGRAGGLQPLARLVAAAVNERCQICFGHANGAPADPDAMADDLARLDQLIDASATDAKLFSNFFDGEHQPISPPR